MHDEGDVTGEGKGGGVAVNRESVGAASAFAADGAGEAAEEAAAAAGGETIPGLP